MRHRWRLLTAVAAAAAVALPLAALAYWTAPSTPGGRGGAVAGSVGAGQTPTVQLSGRSVTLTWPASLLSTYATVSSYTVTRYDTTSGGAQVTGPGCDATQTALTCTENGVPDGSWAYSVTPRYGTNWRGAESARSSAVVIAVPGAPTAVSAVARDSGARVTWTAPSAGSSPITSYTATASPGGATCTATASPCMLSGLTNGTTYAVTVSASSAIGTGPSSASATVTPSTGPAAPTAVSAPAGDRASSVSWTAPSVAGAPPITGYTVTAVPTSGSTGTVTCTATASPCLVQPLVNGLTYTVTVVAQDERGTGAASTAVSTSPYPTSLLTSSNLAIWVDGADPSTVFSDAACSTPATTGTVGCWKDKSGNGLNVTQATAANRMSLTTMNSLPALSSTNTTWYDSGSATGTFRTVLAAANTTRAAGLSTVLSANANVDESMRLDTAQLRRPTTGPAPDGNDWQYNGSGWTSGLLNGTTPTSGPAVFGAEASAQRVGKTVSISSGFNPGGGARGFVGTMGEVLGFNRVLTAAERRQVEEYLSRKWASPLVPGAPATVTATATGSTGSTGTVLAGWTPPAWDGGSPITSYTATAAPGGTTCTSSGSSCTLTGLALGTSYTVSVTATSSTGTGAATASAAATVQAVAPSAPTDMHSAAWEAGGGVSWTAPFNGGSAITGYTATLTPGGATCTTSGSVCEFSGLTDGTTYTATVTATNGVGTGPASTPVSFTPVNQPSPPRNVAASTASTSTAVSWSPPTYPGQSAVSSYTATALPSDSTLPSRTCSATTSPCTIPGLVDGISYTVFVTATNNEGTSSPGVPAFITPYPTGLLTAGNLASWVDAASTGTVFSDSGCTTAATSSSTVACLRSRVGSLTYTQTTAANQFGLTTLNGNRALSSTATTWLTTGTSATFRTVVSVGNGSRTGGALATTFAAPANNDFSQRVTNGALPGSPGASATNGNDWHSGGSAWTSGTLNAAPPSSGAAVYVSQASADKAGSSSISTSFNSRGFLGPLGEVLAFNRVLTTAERRTVEEYLGRKWGAVLSPAAPQSPTVTTQGGGAATVSWTAPAWNGGAAITKYTVTTSGASGTCTWTSGLSANCTGLSTASQTFSVTATNTIGAGPAAVSSAATPTAVTAAPVTPAAPAGPTAPHAPAGPTAPPAPVAPDCPAPASGSGQPVQPTKDDALAQRPRTDVDRRQAERLQCTLRHQRPRQQLPRAPG